MDILVVVYGVTGVSIVNYFCVRELNFKKSPSGPPGPRCFNGQNRTWNSGIFLDLSDVRGTSPELLCDFYPCFKSVILWLGLFSLYLNVLFLFFCSLFVIRLFCRCPRLLDPSLDTSPLKISSHLQWIFTIMITACLELLSLTGRISLLLDVIVQSSMADQSLFLISHVFTLVFLSMLVVVVGY